MLSWNSVMFTPSPQSGPGGLLLLLLLVALLPLGLTILAVLVNIVLFHISLPADASPLAIVIAGALPLSL
jgi:hypothetical protein